MTCPRYSENWIVKSEVGKQCPFFAKWDLGTLKEEAREKYTQSWSLGVHVCYPHDLEEYRWDWICEVPEPAVIPWINEAGIQIGPRPEYLLGDHNIERWRTWQLNNWDNKMAVCVGSDGGGKVVFLYRHDFKFVLLVGRLIR